MHRFYIPPSEWNPEQSQGQLALGGPEAHHCSDVLRCSVGDQVVAFDGRGHRATGTITAMSKSQVDLRVDSLEHTPPPPAALTLCQAIPKGKNMELVVQKATELGTARIVPLLTENTVIKLDAKAAEKKRAKWQRTAIEACKQCGQDHLPEVATPVTLREFLDCQSGGSKLKLVASLQPGSQHLKKILSGGGSAITEAQILVGPEGDFSPAEIDAALAAGHLPITLGPIVLRTETAAIYCLSVLGHELFGS